MPGGVGSNAGQDADKTQAKADGKLSANQVYSLATQAGFSADAAKTMVAIAWDESGFKTSAINTHNTNGSKDYGLFQINSVHLKEAAFVKNGWTATALMEGHVNARAAKTIYDSQGFRAWATYNHGLSNTAKDYAKQAQDPATAPDLSKGNPDGGISLPNPLGGITGAISGAFDQISKSLLKLGLNFGAVAVAIALLVLGVILLMRNQVGAVASKATPIGKIASAAKKVA